MEGSMTAFESGTTRLTPVVSSMRGACPVKTKLVCAGGDTLRRALQLGQLQRAPRANVLKHAKYCHSPRYRLAGYSFSLHHFFVTAWDFLNYLANLNIASK
jgi:hypothetical protein